MLLYHSIPDRDDDDPLGVRDERFVAHMWRVTQSGRVALTISQLAAALNGAIPLPERALAITFDDGHLNNLTAVEHLVEQNLRATVYLTTGDHASRTTLDPRLLDNLVDDRECVEIGAHSVTHRRLDELPPSEIATEVAGCKRHLEAMIGHEVTSFAYPFGSYDRWVRHAVIGAGYTSAVAVKNALSHQQDDPFAIARWTVTRNTSADQIARVLEGEAPRAWQGERMRTRGYRAVRRLRRSLVEPKRAAAPLPDSARARGIPDRVLDGYGPEPHR